jgi:hypothetical protein
MNINKIVKTLGGKSIDRFYQIMLAGTVPSRRRLTDVTRRTETEETQEHIFVPF